MEKSFFINCETCGKRLIERHENGIFKFMFGKAGDSGGPPVEMMIYGSLKMRCLRRTCRQWNTLNFLPNLTND